MQGFLCRVDVARQLAGNIDLITVNATVRTFAFDQIATCVVAKVGVFTPGIDAFTQAAMGVVVIQRLRIAAVAVAEQLTARVPAQVLALFEGIGDLGELAAYLLISSTALDLSVEI